MINTSEVLRAIEYSIKAHDKQVRKYNGVPYITHPVQVAWTMIRVCEMLGIEITTEMVQAAILHDTIEDCPKVTATEIGIFFGDTVKRLTVGLTDTSKKTGLPRKERKELDKKRMKKQTIAVKTIKVFDIMRNCQDMCRDDKKYAVQYINEKLEFIPCLSGINPNLYEMLELELKSLLNTVDI